MRDWTPCLHADGRACGYGQAAAGRDWRSETVHRFSFALGWPPSWPWQGGQAGDWPAGPPIASARVAGDTIALSAGGASRSLGVDTVRDDVNAWAECLEPGRYPSASWKGTQLPTTIPSGWLTVRATPTALVVRGRGWGHGVGMVQWGAYGKAVRGLSAAQILAYYYGGLRPEPFPEPGTIHVVVASGLTAVRILSSAGGTTVDGQEIAGASLLVTCGSAITVTSRP